MNDASTSQPSPILRSWTPIIGALSIWFAHFLIAWGAVSIWPDQRLANVITTVSTLIAFAALAWLFARFRAAVATDDQAAFARRFGLGSVVLATVATLFDAAPALIG